MNLFVGLAAMSLGSALLWAGFTGYVATPDDLGILARIIRDPKRAGAYLNVLRGRAIGPGPRSSWPSGDEYSPVPGQDGHNPGGNVTVPSPAPTPQP